MGYKNGDGKPDKGRPAAHQNDGPSERSASGHHPRTPTARNFTSWRLASQQVSWWAVHEFAQPCLNATESWPAAGTPAWCDLADDDPIKWAALLDAAQHWALRIETCQEASVNASHAISAAENWGARAAAIQQYNEFYAQRPWLRRRTA
jgi:hypothetical protein